MDEDPQILIELGSLKSRSKISLKLVWFMLLGLALLLSDFEVGSLVEPLPRWLGGLIVAGVFVIGMSLLFGSVLFPSLTREKPTELPKTYADQVEKWERSGELVVMIESLSQNETLRLVDMAVKLLGKYTRQIGITRGKPWTDQAFRVGFKILPTGYDEDQPVFSVILYRRDLASLKAIRRPWRTIPQRDGTVQFIRPSRLVELPSWMT